MKKIIFILAGFLALAFALKGQGNCADAQALISQGDQLFAARTPTTGAADALTLYGQAIAIDTASAAAYWRAARACYWGAEHFSVKKTKIELFEKGITFAKRAVELDPKNIDAHFWLAALYGSYGEAKGVLKSLSLVSPIRKELNEVNRLDDHYQGGAGYRVLGVVDYKVPGFAGGSKKRALEELNKALAIDPTNAFTQYYAAEYFGTVSGDKKEAAAHLETLKGLAPTKDVDGADLKMIQEKGERLRAQLGT